MPLTTHKENLDNLNALIDCVAELLGREYGSKNIVAQLMGISMATLKRYRNEKLTIPQSKAITLTMLLKMDDGELAVMIDGLREG